MTNDTMIQNFRQRARAASLLTVAGALGLASLATANDHAVIYHTEVTAMSGPPLPHPPLADLELEDLVEVNFRLGLTGSPQPGGGLRYAAVLDQCSVEPPWARVFAEPSSTDSHVFLGDGASDRLDCKMELPSGVLLESRITGPASMLTDEDLFVIRGAHIFTPVGSTVELTEGASTITLTITDICVFVDTDDGGGTGAQVGSSYCGPANINASGLSATMSVYGTSVVADNDLLLVCRDMPTDSFGFFLMGTTTAFVANPGGSYGSLCLGGDISRFNRACGEIRNSGTTGSFGLQVDLTNLPTPTGPISIYAGDVFHFSSWFRDVQGGVPGSNFADAVSVTFY